MIDAHCADRFQQFSDSNGSSLDADVIIGRRHNDVLMVNMAATGAVVLAKTIPA
jgi:hypothetical protein